MQSRSIALNHTPQVSFRDAVSEAANPQSGNALVLGYLQAGALLRTIEHLYGNGVVDLM